MAGCKKIEYMCRYCGTKKAYSVENGRPQPGRCPRRTGDQPHSWVVNRRF